MKYQRDRTSPPERTKLLTVNNGGGGPWLGQVRLVIPSNAKFIVQLVEMGPDCQAFTPDGLGLRHVVFQGPREVMDQFGLHEPLYFPPDELVNNLHEVGHRYPTRGTRVPAQNIHREVPVLKVFVPPGLEFSARAPWLDYRLTDTNRNVWMSTYPGSRLVLGPGSHGEGFLASGVLVGQWQQDFDSIEFFTTAELLESINRLEAEEVERASRETPFAEDFEEFSREYPEPEISFKIRNGDMLLANPLGRILDQRAVFTPARFSRQIEFEVFRNGLEGLQ